MERPEDVPGEAGEYFAVRIKFAVPVMVKDAIDAHLRGDVGSELIPAAAFQALDAILRHERDMNPLWVSIGRNFLDSKNTVKLSGGFEVWKGYSLSARPTQGAEGKGATHLVVNMAAGAFISEQSAVDRLCVLSDGRGGGGGGGGGRGRGDMRSGGPDAPRLPRLPLDERTWREAHAAFKGIKIELTHFPGSRRKKTCRGLTKLPANRQMFRDDTGRVNLLNMFVPARPGSPCFFEALRFNFWAFLSLCYVIWKGLRVSLRLQQGDASRNKGTFRFTLLF